MTRAGVYTAGNQIHHEQAVGHGPLRVGRRGGLGRALQDQGVQIGNQDRASGTIDGRRGGINMKARVLTQADGSVRVEFNASGAMSEDPALPDRISRAYDARMGR